MTGAMTQAGHDVAESRNGSALVLDERDQPELRDSSEPLDILTWELTALKLDREFEAASWERVQLFRSELAAEIEVRKRQKPWPYKSKDNKPLNFNTSPTMESVASPEVRGKEENPIPVTKSLDISTKTEKKSVAFHEKHALVSKLNTDMKPPLPPRRRSSSTSKQPNNSMRLDCDSYKSPRANANINSGARSAVEPIIVETVDPLPGEYGVPIFVDGGVF